LDAVISQTKHEQYTELAPACKIKNEKPDEKCLEAHMDAGSRSDLTTLLDKLNRVGCLGELEWRIIYFKN